jgi:Tfp pilus assembly protein PilF
MSLIADALDAAQRERARRAGVRQASIPEGPSSFRSVAKRARPAIPRQVAISMAVFAAVVVIAAVISMATASRRRDIQPSAIAAAPPLPIPTQTPVVDTMPTVSVQQHDTSVVATAPVLRPPSYERSVGVYPSVVPPRTRTTAPNSDTIGTSGTAGQNLASMPRPRIEPKGSFQITMQGGAPPPRQNDQLFQQGLAAQQRGDFPSAREFYSRALLQSPRNADILNNLGAVYRAMGDVTAAEDAYRRALDVDPRLAAAWTNLAVVLDAQGRRQEATAALQESLRLDPRNVSTKVNLAIQFSALGLYPEAKRLLEEALKENPALAEAHYTLGQVLEKQNNKPQAIMEYRLFLSTSAGRFPKQEEQVRQHLKAIGAENGN